MFCPQDQTVPSVRSAALKWLPAATAEPLARAPFPPAPFTWTGSRRAVVVASPSSPELLLPQAQTLPSLLTAREWATPAPTATTRDRPLTWTGAARLVLV